MSVGLSGIIPFKEAIFSICNVTENPMSCYMDRFSKFSTHCSQVDTICESFSKCISASLVKMSTLLSGDETPKIVNRFANYEADGCVLYVNKFYPMKEDLLFEENVSLVLAFAVTIGLSVFACYLMGRQPKKND